MVVEGEITKRLRTAPHACNSRGARVAVWCGGAHLRQRELGVGTRPAGRTPRLALLRALVARGVASHLGALRAECRVERRDRGTALPRGVGSCPVVLREQRCTQ